MSSRHLDPAHAGEDEQDQPYEGKHRAPEARSRVLDHGVANLVPDQPAIAPHPLPDTPESDSSEVPGDEQADNDQQSSEVPGDQQAGNGQQPADGSGEWSQGFAEAP